MYLNLLVFRGGGMGCDI